MFADPRRAALLLAGTSVVAALAGGAWWLTRKSEQPDPVERKRRLLLSRLQQILSSTTTRFLIRPSQSSRLVAVLDLDALLNDALEFCGVLPSVVAAHGTDFTAADDDDSVAQDYVRRTSTADRLALSRDLFASPESHKLARQEHRVSQAIGDGRRDRFTPRQIAETIAAYAGAIRELAEHGPIADFGSHW
eukprot:TRINITY_DN6213_c0_g1_i1.p1 TRINITY_DN6213_c0_g1~~TRINITY_DN6213_c0_g1_i1.p1  ORF type:complete len:191 (+),score=44.55 TRINITY_DN6213_c0_g1_i1:197-769(+)